MHKIKILLVLSVLLFSCTESDSDILEENNTEMENGDDPNMGDPSDPGNQGGDPGDPEDPGDPDDPDVCDLEFEYTGINPNYGYFLASHITNYPTEFENFIIQPVEVNNMMAGNAAYPGKLAGQRNGNTGFYNNPLPGSYDINSRDDRDCTVLKRFIVPGFYNVDHNLKIDDNVTRMNLVKNDVFMNSGKQFISFGSNWNDRVNPEENPIIENDVPLRPELTIFDIGFDHDIFQPGFHSYNMNTENIHSLILRLGLPVDGEVELFSSDFSEGGTVNIDVTRSENFAPNEEELEQHFQIFIDISDLKFGINHIVNGAILITWIGNQTPAQEINPIGG